MKKITVGGPESEFGTMTWELPEELTEAIESELAGGTIWPLLSSFLGVLGRVSKDTLLDDIRITKELLSSEEALPAKELMLEMFASVRLIRLMDKFSDNELGISVNSLRKPN